MSSGVHRASMMPVLSRAPYNPLAGAVPTQIKFEFTAAKFFWFLFFEILSLTLFTMYGIASVALTPNVVVASIVSGESAFPNQFTDPKVSPRQSLMDRCTFLNLYCALTGISCSAGTTYFRLAVLHIFA